MRWQQHLLTKWRPLQQEPGGTGATQAADDPSTDNIGHIMGSEIHARQPNETLNQQAWGAAFLLLAAVLIINVAVRARSWGRQIG